MRQDAPGLVEAQIIEHLVTTKGGRLATSEADRASAQQLRDYVENAMTLREPEDLPDFEALEGEVVQLQSRAEGVQVRPIYPTTTPAAALAFEIEADAMTKAGEQSRADYVREAGAGKRVAS